MIRGLPQNTSLSGWRRLLTHKLDSRDIKVKPPAVSFRGHNPSTGLFSCPEAAVYRSLLKVTVVQLHEQSSRIIKELTNKQWLMTSLHAAVVKYKGPSITEQTAPDSLCCCQEAKTLVWKFSFREQTADHILVKFNQQMIRLLHCTVLCYAETSF